MRTIIAVVSQSMHDADAVNVQLFADDTQVVAPTLRHSKPRSRIETDRLENEIHSEIMQTYGVGTPHGWRVAYNSPRETVTIYEYDFDNARRLEA